MGDVFESEKSIFLAAVERIEPAQWPAFLDEACAMDEALRAKVENLLAAQEKLGTFHEAPRSCPAVTIDQSLIEKPGAQIGPYKLLEQIGEGGFGVVFMAEQTEPVRRKVALKVLKAGMDTRQVVARFEAERQALAIMDHPNIARVFDGGATATGRPFFVMELVRGIPITEYCDQNHLSPRERLELFVTVCHSVQHAHQKGLIHRDLKPSNVLVSRHDTTPIVKIIDFGVAKALGQSLTDKTLFTGIAQMIGTPMYMSPEQAGMSDLDVDTRSDIYSLGVLLYELLTGTTPFDKERLKSVGFDEMRRIIREDEPPKPSTRISTARAAGDSTAAGKRDSDSRQLSRLLRGELDWIVMKALEKDRSRRYESASALAADIQRYLSDEPVLACPPTTMYRFQKFARKHKPALATAAAIGLCLILGTTVSAWQAVGATTAEAQANANEQKANTQRDDAERQRDEVKSLNTELRRVLYAAHMNLAKHAWDASGIARVQELLSQHRPLAGQTDIRGFEWHYLNRLSHSEVLVIKGGGQSKVVYSPDGKRLAGQGGAKTVKIWDSQTGEELVTFNGHSGYPVSLAFSPDGKKVGSASSDKTIKLWDAQTGQELLTINAGKFEPTIAFSADGSQVAASTGVSGGSAVKFWDAKTGQELRTLNVDNWAWCASFSRDGTYVALGVNDGNVRVLDAQSGRELLKLGGHTGPIRTVAFSPDSKRLASASGTDMIGPPLPRRPGEVKIWDIETGKELFTLKGHTAGINAVAFSSNGELLASASGDRTAKVWDSHTGDELFTLRGHTGMVWSVAFSPDDGHLVSTGVEGTIRVWNVKSGRVPLAIKAEPTSVVASVDFSPDGKRIATASQNSNVKIWDSHTGEELRSFRGHERIVWSVAFSADGNRLASAGLDGLVKIWDANAETELLSLKGSRGTWYAIAFSPDGKRLASPSDHEIVKVWDAKTGGEILSLPHRGATSVAYSPDGKRLATAAREVKLWNSESGQELVTLKSHTGLGRTLAFSPNSKRLAGTSLDHMVKIWDTESGEELSTLKGHADKVTGVAYSPDGKRLASTSMDQMVKLWDSSTGQELLTVEGHSWYVNGVAFTHDGNRLAAGGPNGTVTIYDATPLPEKP